jgi:hypothetical protein
MHLVDLTVKRTIPPELHLAVYLPARRPNSFWRFWRHNCVRTFLAIQSFWGNCSRSSGCRLNIFENGHTWCHRTIIETSCAPPVNPATVVAHARHP